MTSHLWTPEGFENEFGMEIFLRLFCIVFDGIFRLCGKEFIAAGTILCNFSWNTILYLGCEKADVVNCKTGGTLERFEIGAFWRGFESVKGN